MELKLIVVMMRLFDICTVPAEDVPHLIIIEQPGDVNEMEKFMETTWYDYTYSRKSNGWEKRSSTVYSIPYSHTISTTRKNKTWLAVVDANMHDALYLFSTVNDGTQPKCVPVNLSSTT